jgi:hypothetical protein
MADTTQENDGLSDRRVWSTIRYLDPEPGNQNASGPFLIPLIACLAIWLIFFAALYLLSIRAGDTRNTPIISALKTINTAR